MTEQAENPLEILQLLERLLEDEGYDTSRPAMMTVQALKGALQARGYQEVETAPASSSYTTRRARALKDLSVKLRSTLVSLANSDASYADRAAALSTVSNSYLQLAHAFKVDSEVWSFAQDDLVPVLSAAVDETSLDEAVSKLLSHLDRYIESLSKWL